MKNSFANKQLIANEFFILHFSFFTLHLMIVPVKILPDCAPRRRAEK